MNYIINKKEIQESTHNTTYIMIPSNLEGFTNEETVTGITKSGRTLFNLKGNLTIKETDRICPKCGGYMHVNQGHTTTLRHLCFGGNLTCISFNHNQLYCPSCNHTHMQNIPFKANNHRITEELLTYTKDLLATNKYTLKQVAEITGLGKNVVKDIDLQRLKEKYSINGETLIKPEKTTKILGIDEFKLHNGYKYATHIIDMETGHILWIQEGKKKKVVYDFIDFVGLEWMDNVEAVACDMNSDFQEAFEEKCSHIQPVFDYFHIVKNFNDKVVSEVRKDEERRLKEEGNIEGAKTLKKTKYILTSSKDTLKRKDQEAKDGKIISKGSTLFKTSNVTRKAGYEEKYNELIKENKLLFVMDIVKNKLTYAYSLTDEANMSKEITEIIDICTETKNKHFLWFKRLLESHFEGIIAHATYKISSGKIEGINNKIKTLRRQAYGLPDDEYFFLKLFDASRVSYERNPKSHKICD